MLVDSSRSVIDHRLFVSLGLTAEHVIFGSEPSRLLGQLGRPVLFAEASLAGIHDELKMLSTVLEDNDRHSGSSMLLASAL